MNFNWTDLTGQIRFHDPAGTSFFLQEKVYLLGVAKGRQKITGKQNNRICPYMIYKTNVKYYIVMNKLIPITNWFAKYPFGSGLNRDISAVASGLAISDTSYPCYNICRYYRTKHGCVIDSLLFVSDEWMLIRTI